MIIYRDGERRDSERRSDGRGEVRQSEGEEREKAQERESEGEQREKVQRLQHLFCKLILKADIGLSSPLLPHSEGGGSNLGVSKAGLCI